MHGSEGVVSKRKAAVRTLKKPIRKVAVEESRIPAIVRRNGADL
jgi:hypothetical protein